MHLLQVANVGEICGGTAACAWSVTRALPMCRHTVLFLSPVTPKTRQVFGQCRTLHQNSVDSKLLKSINPDLCLLHNTSSGRFPQHCSIPTILYQHSVGDRSVSDLHVACSRWLANQIPGCSQVLYQGVPLPVKPFPAEDRRLRKRVLVGRICTPTARKWPADLTAFYAFLASRHPAVDWEFVGCRPELQESLRTACAGRARFLPAHWEARKHLWRWDAMLYHHPTLTESFGRTVAESMRAGCIPVVDDRGGFVEQVSPETGFLTKTPADFERALSALEDPGRRRELSAQASEFASRNFSLSAFSGRLRVLFQQILHQICSAEPR